MMSTMTVLTCDICGEPIVETADGFVPICSSERIGSQYKFKKKWMGKWEYFDAHDDCLEAIIEETRKKHKEPEND